MHDASESELGTHTHARNTYPYLYAKSGSTEVSRGSNSVAYNGYASCTTSYWCVLNESGRNQLGKSFITRLCISQFAWRIWHLSHVGGPWGASSCFISIAILHSSSTASTPYLLTPYTGTRGNAEHVVRKRKVDAWRRRS